MFAAVAVAAIVAVAIGGQSPARSATGPAPAFSLASTNGRQVSLADYRGRNVLLYFNEGVGCDACFYQASKLEADAAFQQTGVAFVPIVMNSIAEIRAEQIRLGVRTPYLVDTDGAVSRTYKMLGTGHHADLPGHSFVLVDSKGQMLWRGDYPGMWVEPADLVSAIRSKLP